MSKFSYSPGLPAYGLKGIDGSQGLQAVSLYFTSYDGQNDGTTLKSKIADNKILTSSTDYIPGYPSRVYSNGDMFIDKNGKVYEIDFSETYYYKDTGSEINTEGYFASLKDTPNIGYTRVSNKHTTIGYKYIVDNVIAKNAGDYTTYPTTIYDNLSADFSRINHVDISTATYYLFDLWTLGSTDGRSNDADAIGLTRAKGSNLWRLGNYNGTTHRDVSLYLDFKDIYMAKNLSVDGSIFCEHVQPKYRGDTGRNLEIKGGNNNSTLLSGTVNIIGGTNYFAMAGIGGGDVSISGGTGYGGGNVYINGGLNTGGGGSGKIYLGYNNTNLVEVNTNNNDIDFVVHGDTKSEIIKVDAATDNVYIDGDYIYIGKNNTNGIVCNIMARDADFIIHSEHVNNIFQVDAATDAILMAVTESNESNDIRYNSGTKRLYYYAHTSDIKFKENLEIIDNALNKIDKINGYTFNYNKAASVIGKTDTLTKHAGILAQEIEKVFPIIVKEEKKDNVDYKVVRYEDLVPLLIQSIKELKDIVDKQQKQIDELLK
jgi:hypothetical protein